MHIQYERSVVEIRGVYTPSSLSTQGDMEQEAPDALHLALEDSDTDAEDEDEGAIWSHANELFTLLENAPRDEHTVIQFHRDNFFGPDVNIDNVVFHGGILHAIWTLDRMCNAKHPSKPTHHWLAEVYSFEYECFALSFEADGGTGSCEKAWQDLGAQGQLDRIVRGLRDADTFWYTVLKLC